MFLRFWTGDFFKVVFFIIMRFNRNASLLVAAGLVQVAVAELKITDACPAEVVMQASQEGFLQYVVMNCVKDDNSDRTTYTNFSGNDLVTPSDCLTNWMAERQTATGNPIPQTGDCRVAFQNLVDEISDLHTGFTDNCKIVDGQMDLNDNCWVSKLNYGATGALDSFRTESGHYIGGQQCLSATVHNLANKGAYKKIVEGALGTTSDPTGGLFSPDIDGGNGLCYGCYRLFYAAVNIIPDTTGVVVACSEDAYSAGCLKSTHIQNALAEFKKCSGGFDIMYDGGVCTAADIAEVQTLIPTPYDTLAGCAFDPTQSHCSTVNAYLVQVQAESTSDCVVCYKDFYVTAKNMPAAAVAACTGANGIWSDDCKVAIQEAFYLFKTCSGFDMNTAKTTAVAPTAAATEAPTETTTAAPAVVTTKAGAAVSSATLVSLVLLGAVSLAL